MIQRGRIPLPYRELEQKQRRSQKWLPSAKLDVNVPQPPTLSMIQLVPVPRHEYRMFTLLHTKLF